MRGGQGCACDEAPVGSQMQWFPTTAASQVCREHHSEWSYKGTTVVTQEVRDPTKHKMPPSWTIRLWSTQELCHTHVLWKVQPGQTSFSLTHHCAGRMSNDSVQNQVKKKLFFFSFFLIVDILKHLLESTILVWENGLMQTWVRRQTPQGHRDS